MELTIPDVSVSKEEVCLVLIRRQLLQPPDIRIQRHRPLPLQLRRHPPLLPPHPRLLRIHVILHIALQALRPRQQRRVVRPAQARVARVPGQAALEGAVDGVEHVEVAEVDRLGEAPADELEDDGGLLDLLVDLGGGVAEAGGEGELGAVGGEGDGGVVVVEGGVVVLAWGGRGKVEGCYGSVQSRGLG